MSDRLADTELADAICSKLGKLRLAVTAQATSTVIPHVRLCQGLETDDFE